MGSGYLLRFKDGPMAEDLVEKITGAVLIPLDTFGWPLPNRLGALPGVGNENSAAFWDADYCEGLPSEVVHHPAASVYVKVTESQLPPTVSMCVLLGAEYRLEEIVL
jgi:hypothetical protein